jgi:hypothetical protein
MTISATPRRNAFIGNGTQTSWFFTFKVFDAADLAVSIQVNGAEVLLSSVDYAVSLNPNQDTSPGGSIIYPLLGDPLPGGTRLVIYGDLDYDQPLDLPEGGRFSAIALENQLDRTTMQIQQLVERTDRALRLPVTATGTNPQFPLPDPNKFIAWNPAGTSLINAEIADLAGQLVFSDWLYETFTGDGIRTLFALQRDPASVGNVDLSVDGLSLVPGTDFTVFGNTLSFTTPPVSGAQILARYGRAVGQRSLYQQVYRFTATPGQTVFTITDGYLANQNALAVYLNGLRLEGGSIDYTETNPTTVTFLSPLEEGDSVVMVAGLESFDGTNGGGGGGGGGGEDTTLGGTTLPDTTLSPATPSRYVAYVDTNPNGWNTRPSKVTLDFEWISNSYFAANPIGHFAVATRVDTNVVNTAVFGAGIAVGDLSGADEGPAHFPCTVIETWANGVLPGDNRLIPNTASPRNKLLEDGVQYRSIIESTVADNGQRYIRQRLYRFNVAEQAWETEVDTGDVLDSNAFYDTSKEGVLFAEVFADDLVPWSIEFTNIKVTWGPPRTVATEQRDRMSKYGAELEGDLLFVGDGRRVLMHGTDSVPTNFPKWVRFQSREPGKGTSMVLTPPDGSQDAVFFAANNDNIISSKSVSLGMVGTTARIETLDLVGTGSPPLEIKIGSTLKATLSESELDLQANLKFTGDARRILVSDASTDPTKWTSIRTSQANGATNVLIAPSGTGNVTTMWMSNASGMTTYRMVGLGMNNTEARLEAFGAGLSDPPIRVNVGAGNEVARFTTAGITVRGATRALGDGFENFAAWLNLGSTTARNFTNTTTLDINGLCTDGTLRTFMSSSPSNVEVETVLRPLYCGLSTLIRELTVRKIINA